MLKILRSGALMPYGLNYPCGSGLPAGFTFGDRSLFVPHRGRHPHGRLVCNREHARPWWKDIHRMVAVGD